MTDDPADDSAFAPGYILVGVAIFYAIFVLGLLGLLPSGISDLWLLPVAILGGPLFYAGLLWIIAQGDPRAWRDPVRFTEVLRKQSEATDQPLPAPAEIERLRIRAARRGGIALSIEGGIMAGTGAAATALSTNGFVALLAFGATSVVVGLALRRWLVDTV